MYLYEKIIDEINTYSDFWNYYGRDFNDILLSNENAKQFIKDYFRYGSKINAIGTWDEHTDKYYFRNGHTVNVFFIGAMLQRLIDDKIAIIGEESGKYPFSYIWFLTCLGHDMGYIYEDDSNALISMEGRKRNYYINKTNDYSRYRSIPRFRWYREYKLDILYPYSSFGTVTKTCGLANSNIGVYRNSYISRLTYRDRNHKIKPWYPNALIDKYFYYRINKWKLLDHGIVGGDMLFSKLLINYVNEYRKTYKENTNGCDFHDFINGAGMHFHIEQFEVFRYIASCVAAHNIYMESEDTTAEYDFYNMKILKKDKFVKISYERDPLLFILCIADTVEPYKRFSNINNIQALQAVQIEYVKETNLLSVGINCNYANTEQGNKYKRDIDALREWCNINVETYVI